MTLRYEQGTQSTPSANGSPIRSISRISWSEPLINVSQSIYNTLFTTILGEEAKAKFREMKLEGNTDMRYSWEQRPVFIHGKKVAYLNEKQLSKLFKKKKDVIKEYFASHNVDQYNLDQARELDKLILE